jgi:hypothetical protein
MYLRDQEQNHKTLAEKQPRQKRAVVESMLSKCEALSSNPSTAKKKEKEMYSHLI